MLVPVPPRPATAVRHAAGVCRYREKYPHAYDGPAFDWPQYREVREDEQTVEHIRYMYASLLSFCDAMLGRVLDTFDRLDLWKVRLDSALAPPATNGSERGGGNSGGGSGRSSSGISVCFQPSR
jgi:hypothetical protein